MKQDNNLIDQTPKNAVGVFEEEGVQIFIFPKKDESNEDAIARVAKNHHVTISSIRKLK